MAMLKFNKGQLANLPSAKAEGNVYITTDEKAMYVDISNTERIRIGQIVEKTSTEWENLTQPYDSSTYYYITNINALVRWNGTKWVQINGTADIKADIADLKTRMGAAEGNITTLQTDLSELEGIVQGIVTVGGQANVIEKVRVGTTDLVPDSDKRVTLGKFAAADKTTISDADLDDAFKQRLSTDEQNIANLQTSVNTLVGSGTNSVAGKIESALNDFKTTNVTPLANRVGDTETAIDGINTKIGTETYTGSSLTGAIKQLQTDASANSSNITGLDTRLGTAEGKITAVEGRMTTAEGDITKLKTDVATAQGQADKGVADAATAQAAAETAQGTANTNAQNITNLSTDLNTVKDTYATKTNLADAKTELEGKITTAQNAADGAQDAADKAQDDVDALKLIVGAGVEGTTLTAQLGTVAQNLETLKTEVGNVANLMNFRGVATQENLSDITDPQIGDVAIYSNKEYVYAEVDGTKKWVEYGDASVNAAEITALDERLDAAEGKITTLEETVGNDSKGLVQAVNTNTTNITDLTTNLSNNYYTKTQVDDFLAWGSF